ncbi:hypothetical protein F0251_24505 [Vibrio sp. 070316B]|uniref:hypothetical protein n=1 Tax=Vibrio sp. 070316B TaxID=2607608 RepID=UPI001493923A|nr:hypothetical protein [Vibrio sp. 070316B]NOI41553.1 hypothetical protein [Vibrio sp. 070316B]CAH6937773.1 conserved hypothetical protein [Vibrio chagasii]
MKVTPICYAVRCYLTLYEVTKRRPPPGCLSDVLTHYLNKVEVIHFVESLLARRTQSKGIVSRNSTISIKDCQITNCGTAVDMDSASSIDIDRLAVTNCNMGINVRSNANKEIEMPLNIKNSNFKRVGTAVRAPEQMMVDVDNCDFEDIKIGFDFYIPESDLSELGLPKDTPQELLLEVAKIVRNDRTKDSQTVIDKISQSALVKWLNVTSGIVTVGTPIISNLATYFS